MTCEYYKKVLQLYGDNITKTNDWYSARNSYLPLSISFQDCIALKKIIEHFPVRNTFIIGDGFGFSSNYIALVMDAHGGSLVVTLDNYSEGNSEQVLSAMLSITLNLTSVHIERVTGTSPQHVEMAARWNMFDLCFIDGNHSGEHPLQDFIALQGVAHGDTIFVWHDGNCVDVMRSVDYARDAGYTCFHVDTPGYLYIGSKDPQIKEKYGD